MSTTEAVGLARLAAALTRGPNEEEQQIQEAISRTMGEVLRHDLRNPVTGHGSSPTVRVVGAVEAFEPTRGTGWAEPRPLAGSPMGAFADRMVEKMIDAELGPALPKSAEVEAVRRRKL